MAKLLSFVTFKFFILINYTLSHYDSDALKENDWSWDHF